MFNKLNLLFDEIDRDVIKLSNSFKFILFVFGLLELFQEELGIIYILDMGRISL